MEGPKMKILKVYWGNDDAESTLALSSDEWEHVNRGERLENTATAIHEGVEETVTWVIQDREVTIIGDDASQKMLAWPLNELIVDE